MNIFSVFKEPETTREFLNKNKRIVKAVQGILFFRLPVQYAASLLLTDFILLLIGKFNLGMLQIITLAAIIYECSKFLTFLKKPILDFFFPENIYQGEKNESNRIREANEISDIFVKIVNFFKGYHSTAEGVTWKQIVFYSVVFVFCSLVGTYWLIFVIINAIFLLPMIIFNPSVYPYFKTALDAVFKSN